MQGDRRVGMAVAYGGDEATLRRRQLTGGGDAHPAVIGACGAELQCAIPLCVSRARRQTSLGMRWALAIVLAASLLGALAIVLTRDPHPDRPTSSQRATLDANRLGSVVVREDQAPHTTVLTAAPSAGRQLRSAVAADARSRIAVQDMTGPLDSVGCHALGGSHGRTLYACTVVAGALSYPFRGVVDPAAHRITWCKQDAVSGPGLSVPLSPRCTA